MQTIFISKPKGMPISEQFWETKNHLHMLCTPTIETIPHVRQVMASHPLIFFFQHTPCFVTPQATLLLKGGVCGVAAKPPHHIPIFPLTGHITNAKPEQVFIILM